MFECSEELLFYMLKSDILLCQMLNAHVGPWDMLNNVCFHIYAHCTELLTRSNLKSVLFQTNQFELK